ncbi:hypothetical protein RRG08_032385 [Elysia crispata]|uniref:Uncharacterized protein n=1 Tax=Elysia crispata TaxID=231223 RepID=A0AAE1AGB8_9GAST|nr:hypothetical protein RRG08_032385 [Elysia crispata]
MDKSSTRVQCLKVEARSRRKEDGGGRGIVRPGQAIEDREQTLQEPNFGLLTEAGVDLDLIYLGKDLRRKSGYYWYVKHSDGQLVGKACAEFLASQITAYFGLGVKRDGLRGTHFSGPCLSFLAYLDLDIPTALKISFLHFICLSFCVPNRQVHLTISLRCHVYPSISPPLPVYYNLPSQNTPSEWRTETVSAYLLVDLDSSTHAIHFSEEASA